MKILNFFQRLSEIGLDGLIKRLVFFLRKKKAYFFIFLSRKVLNNEGGLDLYLYGKAKYEIIKLLSKNSVSNISQDNKKIIVNLNEKNYSPIDLNIPDSTLREIQRKISLLIEDDEKSHPRGNNTNSFEKKYYSRAISDLIGGIPEIKTIINDRLINIIQAYYGTNFGITSVMCWRNYHIPYNKNNKIFYSNDWHNDYISPLELKLFINMTNVTDKDGPLHVIDKNETKNIIRSGNFDGRFNNNDLTLIENSKALIKHTGPAGSGFFCHASSCLHRADIPAEGHYRDMLEFQFHPSTKPYNENWDLKKIKYA